MKISSYHCNAFPLLCDLITITINFFIEKTQHSIYNPILKNQFFKLIY
jgi:hypothetical protein